MMWIKYQYVCNILNEGTQNEKVILLEKQIGYNEKNLALAKVEAYNGVYEVIDDGQVVDTKPLEIEFGGTGACTKEDALRNLGGVTKEYVDSLGNTGDLLVKSGEGDEFAIEGTCEFPLLDMKLFGKTTQVKTTGAQCIPFPENGSATQNGITATFKNGKITLSGTSTASVWLAAFTMSLDAGEYTLSSDSIPVGVTVYIFSGAEYFSIRSGALVKTKAFSQGNYNFVIETGTNVTLNSTFQVMLNKGSAALPWELYTGGKVSPCPSYPQELKSSSRVGNLIPFPYADGGVSVTVKDGLTWFVNLNGSIKVEGTATNDSIFMLCNTIQWINDTDSVFDATSSSVYVNGKTFTDCELVRSASNNYLRIRIPSGTTIDRIFYPMVVDGKEEIPFRLYNNGQKEVVTNVDAQQLITTTPNGLYGVPVTSGGNYTDVNGQQWICDEIDFERGVLIKRTHTQTFVGTEPFSQLGSTGDANAFFYLVDSSIKPFVIDNEGFSLSSHFETKRIISSTTDVGHQIRKVSTGEQYRVLFRPENASGMTAAQFQAWLKENPTTVTFALATSTEMPLSADDMKKFESLISAEGTTSFRSDANIIVHCAQNNKVFEKVKDVFDRLWKRIEAIESFMIQ